MAVFFNSSQERDTVILLFRILFSIFIGPVSQKIVTEFRPMHYCLGQFLIHKKKDDYHEYTSFYVVHAYQASHTYICIYVYIYI